MKRTLAILGIVGGLAGSTPAALGAVVDLSIVPPAQTIGIGSPFTVSINASGLVNEGAPSLSAFDLDVSFDASLVQFDDLTFGDPSLGEQLDLGDLGSIRAFDSSTPGLVNLYELSQDPAEVLDGTQAGAFTLAVLQFTALAPGESSLTMSINSLADADGAGFDFEAAEASVTVVPEVPSAALVSLLLAAGWPVLARTRWRRQSCHRVPS